MKVKIFPQGSPGAKREKFISLITFIIKLPANVSHVLLRKLIIDYKE